MNHVKHKIYNRDKKPKLYSISKTNELDIVPRYLSVNYTSFIDRLHISFCEEVPVTFSTRSTEYGLSIFREETPTVSHDEVILNFAEKSI
jgi:hypothetical protein